MHQRGAQDVAKLGEREMTGSPTGRIMALCCSLSQFTSRGASLMEWSSPT